MSKQKVQPHAHDVYIWWQLEACLKEKHKKQPPSRYFKLNPINKVNHWLGMVTYVHSNLFQKIIMKMDLIFSFDYSKSSKDLLFLSFPNIQNKHRGTTL